MQILFCIESAEFKGGGEEAEATPPTMAGNYFLHSPLEFSGEAYSAPTPDGWEF